MSRTIKAFKLLQILKDTINNEDIYIKMSVLTNELDTDDRNIRRIVKLLNESLNMNIISRTGRDGGYRLTTDIYNFFLGISIDDLTTLNSAKDSILNSYIQTEIEQKAIKVINKMTNYKEDMIEDEDNLDYVSDDDDDEFIIL